MSLKIGLFGVGNLGSKMVLQVQAELKKVIPEGLRFFVSYLAEHQPEQLPALDSGEIDLLCFNRKTPHIQQITTCLQQEFQTLDLVILCSALGGDSGEVAFELATLASQLQVPCLAAVVLPFLFEGKLKQQQALECQARLKNICSGVLSFPNQNLIPALGRKTKLADALQASDLYLLQILQNLARILLTPALINIDFSDFLSVICRKGSLQMASSNFTLTQAAGSHPQLQLQQWVESALHHPLLSQTDSRQATAALWQLDAPLDFSLADFEKIGLQLAELLPRASLIISGLRLETRDSIQLTLVIAGQ